MEQRIVKRRNLKNRRNREGKAEQAIGTRNIGKLVKKHVQMAVGKRQETSLCIVCSASRAAAFVSKLKYAHDGIFYLMYSTTARL